MRYIKALKLAPSEFKRMYGVTAETLWEMVKAVRDGKQRCHTLKIQLLINQGTQEILCTALGIGKEHDFRIFKNSRIKARKEIQIVADKGYQGIKTYHNNSKIPYTKPRKGKLSQEQKEFNRQQARVRIKVEHVIRLLKVFRILSSRYRNRRKQFGLRVNLIAGIYNYELKLASKF